METLTKEIFDKLSKGEVFASGILPNSPDGIFMTNNGGELRWVAKNGYGNDWAIYCHWSDRSVEWIEAHGDKIDTEKANDIVLQWASTSNDDSIDALTIQSAIAEEFGVELSEWQKGKVVSAKENSVKWKGYDSPEMKQKKFNEIISRADKADKLINKRVDEELKNNPDVPRYKMADKIYHLAKEGQFPEIDLGFFDDNPYIDSFNSHYIEKYFRQALTYKKQWALNFKSEVKKAVTNYEYTSQEPEISPKDAHAAVKAMYSITQNHFKKAGFEPEDEITLFRGTQAQVPGASLGNPVTVRGNAAESWSLSPTVAANFGGTVLMTKVKVKDILSTCATGFGCVNEAEVVILGGYEYSALVVRHKNG